MPADKRWDLLANYVDRTRLRNDIANQVEVQSVGMDVLQNVLRILRDAGVEPESYEFQTFNQRFSDECAGVFCSAVLLVDAGSECAEDENGGPFVMDGWENVASDVIIRKF